MGRVRGGHDLRRENILATYTRKSGDHFKDIDGFFEDAKKNTLPAYVWVESSYGGPDATDEHLPGEDRRAGAGAGVACDRRAHAKSPAWLTLLLFIMYDEPRRFLRPRPTTAGVSPRQRRAFAGKAAFARAFRSIGDACAVHRRVAVRESALRVAPSVEPHPRCCAWFRRAF